MADSTLVARLEALVTLPTQYATQSLLKVEAWRKPSPTLDRLSQLVTTVAVETPLHKTLIHRYLKLEVYVGRP